MAKRIKISRQGLTECPSCFRFIKVAEKASATHCPFCNGSLLADIEKGKRIQLPGTSVVAASMLSLGLAITGCEDGTEPISTPPPISDTGVKAADAQEDVDSGDQAPDANTQDSGTTPIEDAASPQDSGVDIEDSGLADAGTTPVDAGETQPDASETDAGTTVKDAGDRPDLGTPIPPYGIPPPLDAGQPDATVVKDAEVVDVGTPPTPLYGLPPPGRDAQ